MAKGKRKPGRPVFAVRHRRTNEVWKTDSPPFVGSVSFDVYANTPDIKSDPMKTIVLPDLGRTESVYSVELNPLNHQLYYLTGYPPPDGSNYPDNIHVMNPVNS